LHKDPLKNNDRRIATYQSKATRSFLGLVMYYACFFTR